MEAILGQFVWSSGVTHAQTRRINPDNFPGQNKMGNILMKIRKTLITDEEEHLTTWRGIVENKKHNINNIIINNSEFPELIHQSNISTPEKPTIKRKPTSTPSGSRDRKMQAVHSPENNINKKLLLAKSRLMRHQC